MDGDLLVQVDGVGVKQLQEPVVDVPGVPAGEAPGGLHRVLRIGLGIHIGACFGCWNMVTPLAYQAGPFILYHVAGWVGSAARHVK